MVLAHHLILTAYGFWLPNDPRGSWSDFVGAWELLRFGHATKVTTHRSLAHKPHDRAQRLEAKKSLKYPPVTFNGLQARAVARGLADYALRSNLIVWACAVMPDHVHMVISRHRLKIESVANQIKGAATRQLTNENIHPLAKFPTRSGRFPKTFARGQWKVFLDSQEDIARAIRYVENNPIRDGLRRQDWNFVTPFEARSLPSLRSGRGKT